MRLISCQKAVLQICLLSVLAVGRSLASLIFTVASWDALTAGAPFNITWTGASGTATLTLKNGTASTENTVDVILSGITTSNIVWTPYPTTPSALYVLFLQDTSGQSIYSEQFRMQAAGSNLPSTGLHFTNADFNIVDSEPFNLTWAGASGPVTVSLLNGTAAGITTADMISADITNSYLVWSPYATTPPGQYVLEIKDSTGSITYSKLFELLGPGNTTTSNSSLTATSTTSSTSQTSSSTSTSTSSQTSSSTSTSTSSSQTSSSTSTSTSSFPSSSPKPPPTTGLSSGAKSVIGIACVVGALAILSTLLIIILPRRKRRNQCISAPTQELSIEGAIVPIEIGGQEKARIAEMDGDVIIDKRATGAGTGDGAVHDIRTGT